MDYQQIEEEEYKHLTFIQIYTTLKRKRCSVQMQIYRNYGG